MTSPEKPSDLAVKLAEALKGEGSVLGRGVETIALILDRAGLAEFLAQIAALHERVRFLEGTYKHVCVRKHFDQRTDRCDQCEEEAKLIPVAK